MMRMAMPKGRNLSVAVEAFRAAGTDLGGLEKGDRRLRFEVPSANMEILLLKDWDLPLYVEYGIADFGVVGSDVLEEVGGDVLVPVRFKEGGSRLSLIGRRGLPRAGQQIRLASKYPVTARNVVARKPWGAEVMKLWGSVELAPLLDLAEVALDIVQTGQTLKDNGLTELEVVRDVAPCLIVNRSAYQRHRKPLNDLLSRLEAAGMVE